MTTTKTVTALQKQTKTVEDFLIENQSEIAKACTKQVSSRRLISVVMSSFKSNPDLAKCTFESLIDCVKKSASLGLEPDGITGQAYIIPYEDKKKKIFEAQFQIGYKGLITLARRSGFIKTLYAQPVYKNDKFSYNYGLRPDVQHTPADGPRGELTHAYAVAHFNDGGFHLEVMTKADIEKIQSNSMGANSSYSPWKKWKEEMWRKTATKKLCKYLPFSAELSSAAERDEYDDMNLKEANVTPMTMITDSNKNDLTDRLTKKEETEAIPPERTVRPAGEGDSELFEGDFRSELLDYAKENKCESKIQEVLMEMGFETIDDVDKESEQMVLDYFKRTFKKDK